MPFIVSFWNHGWGSLHIVREKSQRKMVLLQRLDVQGKVLLQLFIRRVETYLFIFVKLTGILSRSNRRPDCLHAIFREGWYRHESLSSKTARTKHKLGRER